MNKNTRPFETYESLPSNNQTGAKQNGTTWWSQAIQVPLSLLISMLTLMAVSPCSSEALVRITPRADYGAPTESQFDRITDKLLELDNRKDLIYSSSPLANGTELINIYTCPTVRTCLEKNCLTQARFWNCEHIFQGSPQDTCETYKRGKQAIRMAGFFAQQLFEGIIASPMAFLQHGVGLMVIQASTVNDSLTTLHSLKEIDCRVLENFADNKQLSDSHVHLIQERKKGQLHELISLYKPSIPANGEAQLQAGSYSRFPAPARLVPQFDQLTARFAQPSFSDELSKIYVPYVLTHAKFDRFLGKDNLSLAYYYLPSQGVTKGVILFLPGQGSPVLGYSELFYNLRNSGYSIYALEHRGQGSSERLLTNPQKTHVQHFSDYVSDVDNFVRTIVKPENYLNSVLIGESMGGAIASEYMAKAPFVFQKAILMSPMFQINVGSFVPQGIAEAYANILTNNKFLAEEYAPGQDNYNPDALLEDCTDTSSSERFVMQRNFLDANPELAMGGVTNAWLKEALEFGRKLRESKSLFQVPTLVLAAGADEVVNPEAEKRVCANNAPNCRFQLIVNAKHDLTIEKNIYRDQMLNSINQFLESTIK